MPIHQYNPYRRSGDDWLALHEEIKAAKLLSTRGTVLESEVVTAGDHYQARVLYQYKAGSRLIAEDALFPVKNHREAEELVHYYRQGASVGVLHKPDNPEESFLGPHIPASKTLVLMSMVLFVFATIVAVLMVLAVLSTTV